MLHLSDVGIEFCHDFFVSGSAEDKRTVWCVCVCERYRREVGVVRNLAGFCCFWGSL